MDSYEREALEIEYDQNVRYKKTQINFWSPIETRTLGNINRLRRLSKTYHSSKK